jgi:hypothetical protein
MAERAAIGMARAGHHVIAGVQIAPQVTALHRNAAELGLEKYAGRKLNILSSFDISKLVRIHQSCTNTVPVDLAPCRGSS